MAANGKTDVTMNIQKNKSGMILFYGVAHAKNVSMPDLAESDGVYVKIVVRALDSESAKRRIKDELSGLGLSVMSILDFISLDEYEKNWKVDRELRKILSFISDRSDISWGNFYAYD